MSTNVSFNEKNLRKVLEMAINMALEYDNELCCFDHMVLSILKLIKKDTSYKDFVEKYNIDELIIEIEKILKNSENNKRKVLLPKFSKYSIDLLSNKVEDLKNNNKTFIDHYDILHLILREDKTNSAKSKYLIFSRYSEKEFFNDLNQLRIIETTKENNNLVKEIENTLEQYCVNLNKLALENKIDNLIGREKELFLVAKTLCRRIKNNVILVGEPGVGKTSIVEGIAKKIVERKIYEPLLNGVIYSVTVGDLLAGTKYRGELEEKIKIIIENLIKLSKIKNQLPILFIDEIHMIMGAGTSMENRNVDIGNILKPVLQKGDLRVIGATTFDEYNKFIEKDKALKRRFNKIIVEEPSEEEAINILFGLKKHYEDYHNVIYTDEAIKTAVKLAKKYIHRSYLPDKAVDIIDNVASKLKLTKSVKNDEKITITKSDIEEEISEMVKIPKEKFTDNEENLSVLKDLNIRLKQKIFGQDSAIDEITSTILVSRAGLRNSEKPEAAFLINGPTGTGKTELCKQIAKYLNMNFARIDMSEFMESHSVSKLIGAPPGYVGYEENEGILFNIVEKNPNSVILFDEVEKAHPQVINILLQILDYGNLTNSKGKTIKFNNCMIFMTSNLGIFKRKNNVGFSLKNEQNDYTVEKVDEHQLEEINNFFSPEFRNRLDGIILFNRLTRDVCLKIIEKFIMELQEEYLKNKNITLELTDEVKNYLLKVGFDEEKGARPLARIIEKQIKYKLAPEILFGDLRRGGKVILKIQDNEIKFDIIPNVSTTKEVKTNNENEEQTSSLNFDYVEMN